MLNIIFHQKKHYTWEFIMSFFLHVDCSNSAQNIHILLMTIIMYISRIYNNFMPYFFFLSLSFAFSSFSFWLNPQTNTFRRRKRLGRVILFQDLILCDLVVYVCNKIKYSTCLLYYRCNLYSNWRKRRKKFVLFFAAHTKRAVHLTVILTKSNQTYIHIHAILVTWIWEN
jgi:hypothetical protein